MVGRTSETTGSVSYLYRYGAYGKLARLDATSGQEVGDTLADGHIGFTGQMFDTESGLWYYGNRYLDPVSGRFLQRDPAGRADGMNMYAYVRNNPLRLASG